MHATEIVGWTCDGAAFCPDHKPEGDDEGVHPIFASDEGWESMTCDEPHAGDPPVFETLGTVAGLEPTCPECGDTLDTTCNGETRCPSCGPPCAACDSGEAEWLAGCRVSPDE